MAEEDLKYRIQRLFLRYPPEDKTYHFCVQAHLASVLHLDVRLESNLPGNRLLGITLFAYNPGGFEKTIGVHRPSDKLTEGMKQFTKALRDPRLLKINLNTGEFQNVRSIRATLKLDEPHPWLDVKEYKSKAGGIGATLHHSGYMKRVDFGVVEYGIRKLDMLEFFFHGKVLSSRYFLRAFDLNFRFVEVPELKRKSTEIGGLLFIKPKSQTPYVLSLRSLHKGIVPPKGISALPMRLRARVPSSLRYWNHLDEKKRFLVLQKLRKAIKDAGSLTDLANGNYSKVNFKI